MKNATALSRVLSCFLFLPAFFCIQLVRLYRVTLSPAKMFLFGPAGECRFEPSCSQYAIDALKIHGALGGGWLAVKRVCRCHPWGGCGCDPVPTKANKQAIKAQKFLDERGVPGVDSIQLRVPSSEFRA